MAQRAFWWTVPDNAGAKACFTFEQLIRRLWKKNEKCWVPKANESGAATLFKVSN